MPARSHAWLQQAGRISLYLLLLCIPFSNAAIEILFGILLFTWWFGFKPRLSNRTEHYNRRIFYALMAYLGVCIASVAFTYYPRISLAGLFEKTFEYVLLFLIAADIASSDSKTVQRGLRFLFLAGWLVVAYALLQEWTLYQSTSGATPLDPIIRKPLYFMRMTGPYKNPNDLATFLMVIGLTALGIFCKRPQINSVGFLCLGLLATGCIVWTKSQGALLGFTFGAFVILVLARNKLFWVAGGLLLLVTIGFAVAVESHLLKVLTLADASSRERLIMWQTAWSMIQEKPWVGQGINSFMANYMTYTPGHAGEPAYAHNCFLQIAAETGLLGLGAFVWFLVCLFRGFLRSRPVSPVMVGMTAGLAAFLVQSAFDTNLYVLRQAALFWTFSGFAFGASAKPT